MLPDWTTAEIYFRKVDEFQNDYWLNDNSKIIGFYCLTGLIFLIFLLILLQTLL
jgi:hypothetical protein